MKIFAYFLCSLLLSISTYGQNTPNRLLIAYNKGLEYYLFPTPKDYTREILFVLKPAFNTPEYSLSIEKKGKMSILKLRSFRSNYWQQVFSRRKEKVEKITSDIDSFSVGISKKFEHQLVKYFTKVITDSILGPKRSIFEVYDGTEYELEAGNNHRKVREYDFSSNENYYQLATICDSICNDLRINIFKERRYAILIEEKLKKKKTY